MTRFIQNPIPGRTARPRARGVAMLLVLVALGVGVVLASVALTSRDFKYQLPGGSAALPHPAQM